jgi:GT2 family glycosyltransferase
MGQAAIVILNFNGEGMLSRFLPNIVENSKFDIVVIDNGSQDNSVGFLNLKYPEIKVLQLAQNFGYSKGYNHGLDSLKGQYDFYLLLNSDVQVTPCWDEYMVQYLELDQNIAAAQPAVLSLAKDGFFDYAGAAGGFLDRLGYPYCRGRILHTIELDEGQYHSPIEVDWASGACFCVRADLFHQFGGFNPAFFAHMEEIDLCWRFRTAGFRVHCNGAVKVYHLGGGTLRESNPFKTYLNFRNSLFMLATNLSQKKLIHILLIRLFLDFAAAVHISFTKDFTHGAAIFKAYWHYLRNRKKITQNNIKTGQINSSSRKKIQSIVFNYYFKGQKKFSDLF